MVILLILLIGFLYWIGVDMAYLIDNFWGIVAFAIMFTVGSFIFFPNKKTK